MVDRDWQKDRCRGRNSWKLGEGDGSGYHILAKTIFRCTLSYICCPGLWKVADVLAPQIKHIRETKLMHHQTLELVRFFCREIAKLHTDKAMSKLLTPFLTAARFGIHEVVEEIMIAFPDVIYQAYEEGHTALHLAVINRHENIYNLTYQMRYDCKQYLSILRDNDGNCVLHLAGKLAPKHRLNLVSGAALQMQRELQWYKVTCYSLSTVL
ncbi:hypothetical protein C3L33_08618, partial [Rhododendron williamsianum]